MAKPYSSSSRVMVSGWVTSSTLQRPKAHTSAGRAAALQARAAYGAVTSKLVVTSTTPTSGPVSKVTSSW